MRLNQLSYLVAIERYGTISRAAEALYVSQPSISVAVRELEEELGYPLLVRNNRGIRFTEEGLQVLQRARNILREVDEIHCIRQETEALSGEIRIGGTPHFCSSILVDVKLRIEGMHPEVHIFSHEDDSLSVLAHVEENELQMGIIQLCDVEEGLFWRRVAELELQHDQLFEERMCVAVGESHPLAGRGTVSFRELAGYPYGTFRGAMNQQVRHLLSELPQPQVFTVEDIGPLRQMLIRRNAYTVIPRRALLYGNNLFRSQLTPLEVEEQPLNSRMILIWNSAADNRAGAAIRREMAERCKDYLELPE